MIYFWKYYLLSFFYCLAHLVFSFICIFISYICQSARRVFVFYNNSFKLVSWFTLEVFCLLFRNLWIFEDRNSLSILNFADSTSGTWKIHEFFEFFVTWLKFAQNLSANFRTSYVYLVWTKIRAINR
jgi:hypothetical protein